MTTRYFMKGRSVVEVSFDDAHVGNPHVLKDSKAPATSAPAEGWTEVTAQKAMTFSFQNERDAKRLMDAETDRRRLAWVELVAGGMSESTATIVAGYSPE